MRTFIHYDAAGAIKGTLRIEELPEVYDHPFGELGEGEAVLELEEDSKEAQLPLAELHTAWKVGPRSKQLKRRRRADEG
ncbi:hypothetical protein ACYSUO_10100 [Streptomyces sp. UC4497]